MNYNKAIVIIFGVLLSSLSQHTIAVAASPSLERLTIGWSAVAGSQAPFWITKEAGLFEKNGLDATMIYLDGGSKATQAMLSGDVPIAQVGGNAPIVARLRGVDITLIGGMLNVLAYSMVVSPEIKRPEDLRGKKLTVSRYGSNSDYATRKILLKWGLKPDIDVAILQIPGGRDQHGAQIQFKYHRPARRLRRRLPDNAGRNSSGLHSRKARHLAKIHPSLARRSLRLQNAERFQQKSNRKIR
jgi:ABC-type nitrate/sulfonate/bicarbonate transport system substrate-binding protein